MTDPEDIACMTNSGGTESSPPASRLSLQDLSDLAIAYVNPDAEFSEGFLREMLRDWMGMGGDEVRALWFDAIERGNRLVERYQSERLGLAGNMSARPASFPAKAPGSASSSRILAPGGTGG